MSKEIMIVLNQDKNYANDVIKRLRENDGYCPCKLERTEDTKCMCKEFRETEEGMCHCGLYVKIKR